MRFSAFHRYPFLLPAVCLGIGIYVGDMLYFTRQSLGVVFCFIGLAVLGLLGSFSSWRKCHFRFRHLFGVSQSLFFLGLGVFLMYLHLFNAALPDMKESRYFRALLLEQPEEKERSMGCLAAVRSDSLAGEVMLYLAKDSISRSLKAGDELLLHTALRTPHKRGNPEEFDYGRFIHRRGIGGTAYVKSGHWKLCEINAGSSHWGRFYSWQLKARCFRLRVLQLYAELGFTGDDLAVLSALTVGEKEYLSDHIRTTYSHTGASHVLALSGLHIGFLYFILAALLGLLPQRKWIGWLRFLCIGILLWAFAFFTGLSPSVVRSVTMFTFFAFAKALGRRHFSLNVLLSAGFMMLLMVPEWLFEIGFQLSFSAVAAILLLQPIIYRLLTEHRCFQRQVDPYAAPPRWIVSQVYRFGRYVAGLMSVSIAAQLGTAPWVLYYFYDFPTHFLLTNLCVVPLVSVIVYLAVGMLSLAFIPFVAGLLSGLLRWCLHCLNAFVCWIEGLPGATIEDCNIRLVEVWLCLALLIWVVARKEFTYRRVMALLGGVFSLCIVHMTLQYCYRPQANISFFSVSECPSVHLVDARGASWLVCADSLPKVDKWDKSMHRYLLRQGIRFPKIVKEKYDSGTGLSYDPPFLHYAGKRIVIVNDDRYNCYIPEKPLEVDCIYLSGTYSGTLELIRKQINPSMVFLDSSLPFYRQKELKKQCLEQGMPYFSLSSEGSYTFWL